MVVLIAAIASLLLAPGCGGSGDGGGDGDGGSDDGGGGGDDGDDDGVSPPVAVCADPIDLVDTSRPDHVVGDGSAASCTEASLADALGAGGTVTFACGDQPVTIVVTAPLMAAVDAVIDGAGCRSDPGSCDSC